MWQLTIRGFLQTKKHKMERGANMKLKAGLEILERKSDES